MKQFKIGDNVQFSTPVYTNLRGEIIAIENGVATIKVPTYYTVAPGEKPYKTFYKDLQFVKEVK